MEIKPKTTDSATATKVSAPAAAPRAAVTPAPVATDQDGHIAGQSWDHNGVSIIARASNAGGENPSLEFVASESAASQAFQHRNFRYTQVFTTLPAAQSAIDQANTYEKTFVPNTEVVSGIKPTGYSDDQMKTHGWLRLTRPA
jgi:hypothetical protein